MADRPHSRKVKVAEGTAEVKKGEKIDAQVRASERGAEDKKQGRDKED